MTKTLEQSELERLKVMQNSYNAAIFALGEVTNDIDSLKDQITKRENRLIPIKNDLTKLREDELSFGEELIKKYGEGNINFETGEIKTL